MENLQCDASKRIIKAKYPEARAEIFGHTLYYIQDTASKRKLSTTEVSPEKAWIRAAHFITKE